MQSQFLFIHQDHLNSLTLELVTRLCHLVFHLQKNYFKFVKLIENYDLKEIYDYCINRNFLPSHLTCDATPSKYTTHLLLFQLIGVHQTL